MLTGGQQGKVRIQHPKIHERTDRRGAYWYSRYWDDVLQTDGSTKIVRRFRVVGPSEGDNRLSRNLLLDGGLIDRCWDSGVRQALKRAAVAEGCDFAGLGPHSFRRANITWRQEVGASSIEASKIAGHSTVRMTEEYTKIQISRQDETTRLIQERLASVGEKRPAVVR